MEFLKYKSEEEVYASCYAYAQQLYENRKELGIEIESVGQLSDLLYDMFMDKAQHDHMTDSLIEYNDEIVSIEEDCEEDTMDITVSKDSLFYANGVLTKNSFGLPATLDWFIAISQDEVLQDNNQQRVVCLKTRWSNKSKLKPELVGVNFDLMRYTDVGSVQEMQSTVGQRKPERKKKQIEFD